MKISSRAGIYTRISNDKEGAGLGVQRQEEDCRALAASLGYDVATVYQDNDISAYQRKKPRTGYRAMLSDLEAGRISVVLAWHSDRLHRRNAELEHFISVIESTGASVATVKGGKLDLATPDGRMTARILGSISQREIEHGKDRIKRAKEQAALAGKWRGGPRPFGYEADGVTIRETDAAAVRLAARQVIAGQSLRSIARELSAAGHRTTSTKAMPLNEITLRAILLRPRNAGFAEYQGEIVATKAAEWPGILTEDTWRAVVSILKDPSRTTNTGSERKWRGSGLYKCGVCGSSVRSTATSGRRRVYRCNNGGHVSRDLFMVDEVVSAVMAELLRRPDVFDRFATPVANKVEPLRDELAALRSRLGQLPIEHADGNLTGQQVLAATARLNDKIEAAERSLTEAGAAGRLGDLVTAADPGAMFQESTLSRQRAIIDALAVVTLIPTAKGRPKGWSPGQPYFDPTTVNVEPRGSVQ